MQSDFEPKHLQRAKETLSRQLETVTSMHQESKVAEEQEQNRKPVSVFARLLQWSKKVFG